MRFDAEQWWYRGNGSANIVADRDFDPSAYRDRSIILYGNADVNLAWPKLLADSPIQLRRDRVTLGAREFTGSDLSVLFLRPRAGSEIAHVGVVGGTGLAGCRLLTRLPVFIAGAGIPDFVVLDSSMLTKGSAGVRAAGFFDNDWSLPANDR